MPLGQYRDKDQWARMARRAPSPSQEKFMSHSSSLFSGYWGTDGFQTHSLRDGWHATGDYGFHADGELFVIGRFKDIVIVGGNNIFPEDVEAMVNTIQGVYPGRVVAFGVEDQEYGTQSLGVVAEMKSEFREEAAQELEAAIRKLVLSDDWHCAALCFGRTAAMDREKHRGKNFAARDAREIRSRNGSHSV